jgi:hypothetical protein
MNLFVTARVKIMQREKELFITPMMPPPTLPLEVLTIKKRGLC